MEIKKIKDWLNQKPEPQFRTTQMYRSDTFELAEVAIRLSDNEIFMLGLIGGMTILKFHNDMVNVDYKYAKPEPETIVTAEINSFHAAWSSSSLFRGVKKDDTALSEYPKRSPEEILTELSKILKKHRQK